MKRASDFLADVLGDAGPAPSMVRDLDESGPQLPAIMRLHRHKDGYISFATSINGLFRPFLAIRSDEINTYFPECLDQLCQDSFVSINSSWRPAKNGKNGPSHGYPKHDNASLRHLCACYADIDYYKAGIDFGEAFGRVCRAQDSGIVPAVSIVVRSGRGMWLLWLLHDTKSPGQSPGAYPEKLELYLRVQKEIIRRLATVGADPQACDAARYIRVPGSLHTGSKQNVEWWIQGQGESGYLYTLQNLAEFFGIQVRRVQASVQAAFADAEGPKTQRGRGPRALTAYRLRDFQRLRSIRGGFSQGCRNRAALLYAWLLKCWRVSQADAELELYHFGQECHPPLTSSESRNAVKSVYDRQWRAFPKENGKRRPPSIRWQTMADWFDVTIAESQLLEKIPPASRFSPRPDLLSGEPRPHQISGLARQNRQLAIWEIVDEVEFIPTTRAMSQRLRTKGIQASHVQISKDYKSLGLNSRDSRQAKLLFDGTE